MLRRRMGWRAARGDGEVAEEEAPIKWGGVDGVEGRGRLSGLGLRLGFLGARVVGERGEGARRWVSGMRSEEWERRR